jgi:hypothetical protein
MVLSIQAISQTVMQTSVLGRGLFGCRRNRERRHDPPKWKSMNVRPTKVEICAPAQFHRYTFNYPDSESGLRKSGQIEDGTAPCAIENYVIPAFLERESEKRQNTMKASLH